MWRERSVIRPRGGGISVVHKDVCHLRSAAIVQCPNMIQQQRTVTSLPLFPMWESHHLYGGKLEVKGGRILTYDPPARDRTVRTQECRPKRVCPRRGFA
jgi:hypothetical protein